MTSQTLNGLKVAILVTDGFEQVEMTEPRNALDAAGADTRLVSPKEGEVKAWDFTDWGGMFPVDVLLEEARPEAFDALLLPGGVINPEALRTLPLQQPIPLQNRQSHSAFLPEPPQPRLVPVRSCQA